MTKETVKNIKSGKEAIVISRYNRRSDGVAMIEVYVVEGGRKAYWKAVHCE